MHELELKARTAANIDIDGMLAWQPVERKKLIEVMGKWTAAESKRAGAR
jgi:hypothetical protein